MSKGPSARGRVCSYRRQGHGAATAALPAACRALRLSEANDGKSRSEPKFRMWRERRRLSAILASIKKRQAGVEVVLDIGFVLSDDGSPSP
jgi:hypothetical protein